MTKRRLRALLVSDEAFAAAVDPGRGLVEIDYTEAVSESSGDVKRARHLCGPAMTQRLRQLRRRFQSAVSQDLRVWGCRNQPVVECTLAGDHDTPDTHLRFSVDAARGTLVLGSVLSLQEASMSGSWRRALDLFVRSNLERLSGERCPD